MIQIGGQSSTRADQRADQQDRPGHRVARRGRRRSDAEPGRRPDSECAGPIMALSRPILLLPLPSCPCALTLCRRHSVAFAIFVRASDSPSGAMTGKMGA
ncbi:hypothetical protein SAV14893_006860 [Streptomyces avermitilis]|uniref:Uncharacterized protein n=1 Tax=Streptomyces avermitilis TaxID=33903 RepID=A0A4D4LT84_STRAX|nr:hypothetical protein SAV14893_006860 [Streptomyces avermitilis]